MDYQYHDSRDFSSYDYAIYPLDSYNSGSSAGSSPHLGSPSPQFVDFDMPCGLFGFMSFATMEPGECLQTHEMPVGIAPQELHAPAFFQPLPVAAEEDPSAIFAIPPQEPVPLVPPTSSGPLEAAPVPRTSFPMKKDRARGDANLRRSAADPERQNACTMCIRKFKRRADLARHLKRHQGIRPYECLAKSCPLQPSERFFFRADARQRHWRAHPSCEAEFYLTEAGVEWVKKNRNRSQKRRGAGRRSTSDSRDTSLDLSDGYNDEDDADYHD